MHSFDAPSGATYYHNGDFSGGIKVHHTRVTTHNNGDIEIPFEDLRALYLEYLRGKFINLLEEATFDEIERELPILNNLRLGLGSYDPTLGVERMNDERLECGIPPLGSGE